MVDDLLLLIASYMDRSVSIGGSALGRLQLEREHVHVLAPNLKASDAICKDLAELITGSALRENDCNSILGYNMIIKINIF